MITLINIIQNNQVTVMYNVTLKTVSIQKSINDVPVFFAGWDGLKDLFESFVASFSIHTDYKTACEFFKPVSNFNIHGK